MKLPLATINIITITINTDTVANREVHPIIGEEMSEGVELVTGPVHPIIDTIYSGEKTAK